MYVNTGNAYPLEVSRSKKVFINKCDRSVRVDNVSVMMSKSSALRPPK